MKYQAIIFDLDGTLLDTLEDIADSANIVLSRLGFPQHDLATYKYFLGEGIETLIRRAIPKDKKEESLLAHCVMEMRAEYRNRWANKTRLYPEIPEMLDTLTEQGIKMAILSNKPDDFTQQIVAKFLSPWHFEMVQGENHYLPKKPDPQIALRIAKTIKIPPPKFLFLGDTEVDMQTARAAGMYPVGVLWGFRTAAELTLSGAQALIAKTRDLLEILYQ